MIPGHIYGRAISESVVFVTAHEVAHSFFFDRREHFPCEFDWIEKRSGVTGGQHFLHFLDGFAAALIFPPELASRVANREMFRSYDPYDQSDRIYHFRTKYLASASLIRWVACGLPKEYLAVNRYAIWGFDVFEHHGGELFGEDNV